MKILGQTKNGQIVVEYILLLSLSVIVAVLITTAVVSRSPGNEGFLMKKWKEIIEFIASDLPDEQI